MIAILLSLLVVGSIWAPCDDEAEHDQTEIASDHDDESGEHDDETCSPFCSCQCCKSQSYQPQLIELYSLDEAQVMTDQLVQLINEDLVFREERPPRPNF